MAIKYYCDGCDKIVPYDKVKKVNVNVADASYSLTTGTYELCKGCCDNLLGQANPKTWVRCREAAE